MSRLHHFALTALLAAGCAGGSRWTPSSSGPSAADSTLSRVALDDSTSRAFHRIEEQEAAAEILRTAAVQDEDLQQDGDIQVEPEEERPILPSFADEEPEPAPPESGVILDQVIDSVYRAYPLLEAALYSRNIALGDHVAAQGAFDLNLSGASENEPMGFYKNFRQSINLTQPMYGGGEVFSGYRIGRGNIQPWYKGRDTDEGGEFSAGMLFPLIRNRAIDERRAQLWRTDFGRHLVEAEIQAQLISFVQDASHAYWDWIAAGETYDINARILRFAEDRTGFIRRRVEEEVEDPPVLNDNLRLVAERRARLADARRRLEQTAARLSLYLRDQLGRPVLVTPEDLPPFPAPYPVDATALGSDIQRAVQQRPELRVVDITRRQLDVDMAQARNQFLPSVDAALLASQDVGAPTTPLRDKSEFELEASVFLDVPIQRRFARGRMAAADGRISQLLAQRRLIEDQIAVDVQVAYAALVAAYEEAVEARTAVEHADFLVFVEQRKLEEGLTDLLTVAFREQFAAETAQQEVEALRRFFQAQADYRAAVALDRLE